MIIQLQQIAQRPQLQRGPDRPGQQRALQLNGGVDKAAIDNTIWPEDFEASVDSFYESRDKSAAQKKSKRMGFVIE